MEDACEDPAELQAIIENIPEVAMKAVCVRTRYISLRMVLSAV